MPPFDYKARNRDTGQLVTGSIEVQSADAGIALLRERGLMVTSINVGRKYKKATKNKGGRRVSLDDLVIFTRQMAVIVNAGLPLIEGLNILGEQMENVTFREVIKQIEKDVEGGSTLTDAMAKHGRIFNTLYVNLVKAGEASGMLDEILVQLAIYIEKAASLQRKVKSATIYPSIVISVAIIVVSVLMVVVIPVFEEIFKDFGANLPKPTAILIGMSKWIRQNFLYLVGSIVVFLVFFIRALRTKNGRHKFDELLLKLPVFGDLFRKVAVAKFSRTFSTLLRSGVNILVALEIVAKTSGNMVVEDSIDHMRMSIKEGESIAGPLKESGVFPPMVIRMIDVGERTGALDEMLQKIADFYEDQVDVAVGGLTQMLEPIMIVFLGVVVGGIVIAMFMPLFKLTEVIRG
jgi:type IV pilus assembly protein PilC